MSNKKNYVTIVENISNKIRHGINERIVCIQYLSWKHKSQAVKAYLQVNFLILLEKKKIEDYTGNLTRIALSNSRRVR